MNPLELQVLAIISGAPENGQGPSLQDRLIAMVDRDTDSAHAARLLATGRGRERLASANLSPISA